jgi:hypothetical protein
VVVLGTTTLRTVVAPSGTGTIQTTGTTTKAFGSVLLRLPCEYFFASELASANLSSVHLEVQTYSSDEIILSEKQTEPVI